jgi:hypothetical protein
MGRTPHFEQEGRFARLLPNALVEEAGTESLGRPTICSLGAQADTPYYAHLGRPLADGGSLIPSTNCRPRMYCTTRAATGLIRTGTQWTKRFLQIIENRLSKRNFRTY